MAAPQPPQAGRPVQPHARAMAAAQQAALSPFTTQRIALYGTASTCAALGVIARAFRQRSNFYAATVWLARSNGSMLILLNFAIFMTFMFGKIVQAIFFGQLRSIEVEHLYERSWYAVTETLLAMTIFRDEFDSSFVLLFGTLLFLKVFHWLCSDRVELMEQSQTVSRLFHARMISVLSTLLCLDFFLVAFTIEVLLIDKQRMGIMIMFASEFMILTATLFSTYAKYIINVIDMQAQEPWQAKSIYISAVELVTDFCKLSTYVVFFCLILTYYGLPLNIVRDVYVTARAFFGRIRDLLRYRAATRNMDTRFPNATHQDLDSTDRTCIICREEMTAAGPPPDAGEDIDRMIQPEPPAPAPQSGLNETPKKLVCGHIFHFHCLRSWLERQQSCPTCRRTVFEQEAPRPAQPQPQQQQQQHAAPPAAPAHQQQQSPAAQQPPRANGVHAPPPNPTLERLQDLISRIAPPSATPGGPAGRPQQGAPSSSSATAEPAMPGNGPPTHPSDLPLPRFELPSTRSRHPLSQRTDEDEDEQGSSPASPAPADPEDPRKAARMAALKRFEALGKGVAGTAASAGSSARSVTTPAMPNNSRSNSARGTPAASTPAPAAPRPAATRRGTAGGMNDEKVRTLQQEESDEQIDILQQAQHDLFRISADLTRVLSYLKDIRTPSISTPEPSGSRSDVQAPAPTTSTQAADESIVVKDADEEQHEEQQSDGVVDKGKGREVS